jgi:hypothetical protein
MPAHISPVLVLDAATAAPSSCVLASAEPWLGDLRTDDSADS